MITKSNIDNLYKIVSNLSFSDYEMARGRLKVKKDKFKMFKDFSYSLSGETLDALEIYKLACKNNISKQDKERVKAFLLKVKIVQPYLLERTNGNYEQWKKVRSA